MTDLVIDAAAPPITWSGPVEPRLAPPGSPAHKALFCRMLLDTFDPYRPAVIDWPHLDPDALQRLTGLPIWDIAVRTEGKASINVRTYAATIDDPLLREAVELNGFEESRHKEVLHHMVTSYGVALQPEPPYPPPRDAEWAFMKTGYSECIDSFFAFGLFALAKRSGFFPAALVDTFEPVIQEEARHILFFVNWAAWRRRNLPVWRRPLFDLRRAAVWIYLAWERIGIARDIDGTGTDNNFTVTGSEVVGGEALSPRDLIVLCLAENERRMAGFDARLRRPNLVPSLARIALRLLPRPRRQGAAA
jgi:hypothetical protein